MCDCNRLAKLLATNFSYYQCIDCGKEYFSSGQAKVVFRWYDCPMCNGQMYHRHGDEEGTRSCTCGYKTTDEELKSIQLERMKKFQLIEKEST